jgi:pimeloyl-ACP methyl ester carboxylesterase
MIAKAQYTDGYWQSSDGLKLHYRDYGAHHSGPKSKPPILCLPGLTRNTRDFAHVAERLAGDWRVICVELRGRGESAYAKDPATYNPMMYVQDIVLLLTELKLKNFISFGTSLGGILTMLLAATKPGMIKAALINDIGPVIETAGLDRIKSFVGKSQSWPTWTHAARWFAETQGAIFPHYDLQNWIGMAKRICRLTAQGRIVFDYDMKLSEPMKTDDQAIDLWPLYQALGDVPVAVLRGGTSDLFSDATAKKMAKVLPNAKLTTVPNVGHAPMLDEGASIKAIDALLKSVSQK